MQKAKTDPTDVGRSQKAKTDPTDVAEAIIPKANSDPIVVRAPPELARLAKEVAAFDRSGLQQAWRLAGLPDEVAVSITVVLAAEDSELAKAAPLWVAGYADAERGTVVLFPARALSYPDDDLRDLLYHEAAHVYIARAARGRPVPRWFHEGLAMVAGRSWGLKDTSVAALELFGAPRVPFARLDPFFRKDKAAARRAYALAGTFVHDLVERHGADAPGEILERVGRGEPFEAAYLRTTGMNVVAAERIFWKRHNFVARLLPFATSPEVLWVSIALLAVYAIRRRYVRDAALRRLAELEDARAALRENDDEIVN